MSRSQQGCYHTQPQGQPPTLSAADTTLADCLLLTEPFPPGSSIDPSLEKNDPSILPGSP